MRGKGICYETGFVHRGMISRKDFDSELVSGELGIIRNDLHCNAVRVIGGDPERIELAGTCAADRNLEVWFSPYPLELSADEMLSLFADCAARAERLRRHGTNVVFVTGAELSLMNRDFLPGDSVDERIAFLLSEPDRRRERVTEVGARINDFLGKAARLVRQRFSGKLTYASVPMERVDWTPFDIVSVDLYRSVQVASQFSQGVRSLVLQGKPVAITEFGAATYRGAGDRGAQGLSVVEHDPETRAPIRLNGKYVRDEAGQARYLREVLEVFDTEGVDSTFVFAFALHSYPYRPADDPRDDLDLASYGIVKVLERGRGETYPNMPWEPKAAFTALADYYRQH